MDTSMLSETHLDKLIEDNCIEARQILHIVPLHDGAVLPHMGSQLLHVEDQLSDVPKMIFNKWQDISNKQRLSSVLFCIMWQVCDCFYTTVL